MKLSTLKNQRTTKMILMMKMFRMRKTSLRRKIRHPKKMTMKKTSKRMMKKTKKVRINK